MKASGPIPSVFQAGEGGWLKVGDCGVNERIEEAGRTPLFLYDKAAIGRQVARFKAAMPDGIALHYAVKANPYRPLLNYLAKYVDGFDVASAGEIEALSLAEANMLPVSLAGPGKSDLDLTVAIRLGATINVESEREAERALAMAADLDQPAKLTVRVNPPFALKGAGMKMGGMASPFGVGHERAAALVKAIFDGGGDWRGLHIFAGSQLLDADALIDCQRQTVALAASIADQAGAAPPEVNLGGGFGIPYFHGDRDLDVERIGAALAETLVQAPDILAETKFALELGRWLVGEAGVYLARIVDRKESGGRTFLITDGGLHHMLAASGNFGQLLRRNYPVAIAHRFRAEAEEEVTITGCLCTPLDLLADQVLLPRAEVGDVVAIFCAGAYGLTASPQGFLGQPPAKEWLV